jgi:hypothetical protein
VAQAYGVGVTVLADFAENGRIERAFADVGTIHLVPAMEKTLRDYVQYCKDRLQLRPGTLHGRTTELTIFLDFLHQGRRGRWTKFNRWIFPSSSLLGRIFR